MQEGWPVREEERPDLLPYNRRRYELSTRKGGVLWGNRVVIPCKGKKRALESSRSFRQCYSIYIRVKTLQTSLGGTVYIHHVQKTPYHPASNVLVERAVQIFKKGMKRVRSGSVNTRLSRFLLRYRITPHSATCSSPAELMMGKKLQTQLDLMLPDVGS